jgi:hypothetical protein
MRSPSLENLPSLLRRPGARLTGASTITLDPVVLALSFGVESGVSGPRKRCASRFHTEGLSIVCAELDVGL